MFLMNIKSFISNNKILLLIILVVIIITISIYSYNKLKRRVKVKEQEEQIKEIVKTGESKTDWDVFDQSFYDLESKRQSDPNNDILYYTQPSGNFSQYDLEIRFKDGVMRKRGAGQSGLYEISLIDAGEYTGTYPIWLSERSNFYYGFTKDKKFKSLKDKFGTIYKRDSANPIDRITGGKVAKLRKIKIQDLSNYPKYN